MRFKYNLRGVVGKELNEREIKQYAKSIVNYIYKNRLNASVIIARDNRESGDYIFSILCGILLKSGVDINYVGIATTPQLAYLTRRFKFGLGIMITASHNSWEYNGFKCFDIYGNMIDIDNSTFNGFKTKKYGRVIDFSKYKEVYFRYLKNQLNANKLKCMFDCANGASVEVVRKVFPRSCIIGNDTTGRYINCNYGSQCLDNIKSICKRNKKIGFAFDGDGDRVLAIDESGNVIDGDKMLYILATQKLGFGDKIVGTQITSIALEISLRRLGVSLIREKVGAKYVERRLKIEKLLLGGESCGHVFLGEGSSDAMLVVVELLNILNRTGLNLAQLLIGYKQIYKASKDISINKVGNLIEFEQVDKSCRVVVRKSATENLLRIFVECEDDALIDKKLNDIVDRVML